MASKNQLFVLAAVGTDHHPFDRFVTWLDTWQQQNADCEVFIQRGTTKLVPQARSAQWLEPKELDSMMHRADAIVCHGGPSTIMEARQAGVVPVVIPRNPQMGEHVDEHQMRFAEFMGAKGVILPARSEAELSRQLARIAMGDAERVVARTPTETLDRISSVIGDLMSQPSRQLSTPWSRS